MCVHHAVQLGREFADIRARGATVYAIGPGGPRMAGAVAKLIRPPFPLLYDPKGEVFQRFGFEKRMYVVQESGTVFVDRSGIVRYVLRSTNPAGSLDLPALLEYLPAGRGRAGKKR